MFKNKTNSLKNLKQRFFFSFCLYQLSHLMKILHKIKPCRKMVVNLVYQQANTYVTGPMSKFNHSIFFNTFINLLALLYPTRL